jgi:hypothetical protein
MHDGDYILKCKISTKGHKMKATLMMITISALVLVGCATTGMSGAFDKDGLPKQQYYVGGGFSINYQAPGVPGTVYVVEVISRKLLVTESLDKDQVYSFNFDPVDDDVHTHLKTMGIDPLNLKFSLYFVPQQQAEEVSDK